MGNQNLESLMKSIVDPNSDSVSPSDTPAKGTLEVFWTADERLTSSYRWHYFYRFDASSSAVPALKSLQGLDHAQIMAQAQGSGFTPVTKRPRDLHLRWIAQLDAISRTPIEGRPLREWLRFEGISLWQFLPECCYLCYSVPLQETVELIEYLSDLIERFRPSRLVLAAQWKDHQKMAVSLISQRFKVPVEYRSLEIASHVIQEKPKTGRPDDPYRRLEEGQPAAIREYVSSLRRVQPSPPVGDNPVLLLSFPRVWTQTPDQGRIDSYYEPFRPFFRERGLSPVRIELPYYFQIEGGTKSYIDTVLNPSSGDWPTVFWDEYGSDTIEGFARQCRSGLQQAFERLIQSPEFHKAMSWRGISLVSPLVSFWQGFFVDHLALRCIPAMMMARRVLDAFRPRAVLAVYEIGLYARAMIIEAHRRGIPTLGLQHAFIFSEHEYYLHDDIANRPDLTKGCDGCIVPSKTLLFGPDAQRTLTQRGHYPIEATEVIGCDWRCFGANPENPAFLRELKAKWSPSGRKIALVISQSSLTYRILHQLIHKLPASEYAVLIKLHPDDKGGQAYRKILSDNGFEVQTTRDYLKEAIRVADLIFASIYSTASLESLYHHKRVYSYRELDLGYVVPWEPFTVDVADQPSFDPLDWTAEEIQSLDVLLRELGYDCRVTMNDFIGRLHGLFDHMKIGVRPSVTIENSGYPGDSSIRSVLKGKKMPDTELPKDNEKKLPAKIDAGAKIVNSELAGDVAVGEGSLIENACLSGMGRIIVGNYSTINGPNTDLYSLHNPIRIGNFCSIARNVSMQEYDHIMNRCTSYFILNHVFGEDWKKETVSKGPIDIGSDVWIGTQTVIVSGSKIGHGAVIGANSVINGEIPPYAIAAGSPAKVIKYRFEKNIIDKLLEMKWWDWPIEKIKINRQLFEGELTIEKLNHVKPLVSAVIPAYNRQTMIVRAIESVLNQTCPVDEIIIVDDKSTDRTVEVVGGQMARDKRIKLFCHPTNKGAQAARNTGIKAATGQWIAFLDSDDVWLPDRIRLCLDKAREMNVPAVHTEAYMHKNGQLTLMKRSSAQGYIFPDMLKSPGPTFPGLLVRKECLLRVGLLDESLPAWQEWDAFLRLSQYYPFAFVPEPCFVWDAHENETISKDKSRDLAGYERIVEAWKEQILQYAGRESLEKHLQAIARKRAALTSATTVSTKFDGVHPAGIIGAGTIA
jgi:virginiamycin A acetyltransferase